MPPRTSSNAISSADSFTASSLTTNGGSELIANLCKDLKLKPDWDGINKALRQPMLKTFPAALLGRLSVVSYYPLSERDVKVNHSPATFSHRAAHPGESRRNFLL